MLVLIAALAASLLLLWGAYRLGRQSVAMSVIGAGLLVVVAWRVSQVDTSNGEGAAAGVVIIPVIVWSLVALSLLLAVALLVGAIRAHDSVIAKAAIGLVLVLGLVMVRRPGTVADSAPSAPSDPRADRAAGYAWAIEQGVTADSACHGDSVYVAGCRAGVMRNQRH